MATFFKQRKPVVNLEAAEQKTSTDDVIFGKDKTEKIVSIEVDGKDLIIFREVNGKVESETRPNTYWIVNPNKLDDTFKELDGSLHYRYIKTTDNFNVWLGNRNKLPNSWSVWNQKEAALIYNGITYFKGMDLNELSVLSFDIEAYGLMTFKHKEVYMISCTLWKNGQIIRKQFCEDELGGERNMLLAFCDWVREVDPSVLTGWNIYGYDLPYMAACAKRLKINLNLGRDGSNLNVSKKMSKFRYDGANDWEYYDCGIYGREIIDCVFLAVRYDIGRRFHNWKLKVVTEQLYDEVKVKLDKGKKLNDIEQRIYDCNQNRTFYDAGTIRDQWGDPIERRKIKQYCLGDGDDALNFFHLAVPAFFYLNQKVPKPFCDMINKATGSQMNSLMVRAYLQENHSLPKPSEKVAFEGAISLGMSGVYKNVVRLDVSSLYPSIMRQYKVFNQSKDPKRYFLLITDFLTEERLENKKIANETGSQYHRDMEQSGKIGINSLYGFLGATGLLFNSPEHAAFITRKGREILNQAIVWATGQGEDFWREKM